MGIPRLSGPYEPVLVISVWEKKKHLNKDRNEIHVNLLNNNPLEVICVCCTGCSLTCAFTPVPKLLNRTPLHHHLQKHGHLRTLGGDLHQWLVITAVAR